MVMHALLTDEEKIKFVSTLTKSGLSPVASEKRVFDFF